MATYDNDLRLKEITTGDEDGTWGDSTNTNLELIADGFSYGTKEMAADANETFTMPDFSADATRSLYLKITSAVSLTATREVTLGPNTVSKTWIIENATSGSQIITIKQGSGATVNVPNGSKVMVVTDGAGAGAAVFNANPTEVGGTVTSIDVSGGTTGLTTSGGPVTTSGTITLAGTLAVANGGTGVTSSTGTGSVVLSNSPTFTGTVTIPTADINGGTIDGTVIGGSTAAAGTFTTGQFNTSLNVDGTATLDGLTVDRQTQLTYGSIDINGTNDSSIRMYNSGGTANFRKMDIRYTAATGYEGLYFRSINDANDDFNEIARFDTKTGDISFYEDTGTTPKFFWDASAESLGIGTTSPTAKLHVGAVSSLTGNLSPTAVIISDTNTSGSEETTLGIYQGGDYTGSAVGLVAGVTSGALPYFAIKTRPTAGGDSIERLRITSTGDVGIGTSSPTAGLECVNTFGAIVARSSQASSTNSSLRFMGGAYTGNKATAVLLDGVSGENRLYLGGGTSYGEPATDIRFYTGTVGTLALGTEKMRIASSGNVGIGTTSPTSKLQINGDGTTVRLDGTANTSRNILIRNVGGSAEGILQTDGNMHLLQEDASKYMRFSTANTERMRITSTGNVGIGTSTIPTGVLLGRQLVASSSTGAEIIAFREDSSVDVGNIAGAFLIGNSDTDGVEDHFVGMWGKVSSTNGSQNLHFAAGRSGYEGDAPQMTIDSSGNVGIGTSSPIEFSSVQAGLTLSGISGSFPTRAGVLSFISQDTTSTECHIHARDAYMAFETGTSATSAERMRIDASGNVGIGTSSPDQRLTISGTITQQIKIIATEDGTDMRVGASSFSSGSGFVGTVSNHPVTFITNNTERMRIDTSGNLLVGKTATDVTVVGTELRANGLTWHTADGIECLGLNRLTSDGDILEFRRGGTTVGIIGSNTSGTRLHIGKDNVALSFAAGGANSIIPWDSTANATERMRIDASGNVGIGTTSPQGKLNVIKGTASGTTASTNANNIVIDGTSGTETGITLFSTTGSGIRFGDASGAGQGVIEYGHASDYMRFVTNAAEAMRIDSSGDLLVGTTTNANNARVKIAFTHPGAVGAEFFPSGTTATQIRFNNSGGTQVGSITSSGAATAYNTSSDQRLKENIADADDVGSKVDAIQVRQFDWKVDGSHQDYGMVAQELLTVAPEAVSVPEDPEDMMGVDYSKLVPMLIKEIQSLRNRVATLEGN
jgi:hypothetical protein